MEDRARIAAINILYDLDVNKAYSNILINEYYSKHALNSTDRGFATEIIYGTIRWRLKLDYLIQRHINTRLDESSPWVLACIRAALYQVYFMDRVPDFAAVDASVEIAKTREPKAAPFVNGVLRSILRNRDQFNEIGVKNKAKRMAIEYSHPEWFVKKFAPVFGEKFLIDLMTANNTAPPLTARVNSLKTSREELLDLLTQKGVSASEGSNPEAICFDGYSMLEASEEFKQGLFLFQDESSMLVARVLDPQPGDRIIDVCSAPGGKTTHIAQLMKNKGEIFAFDIYKHKLSLIEDNAQKLGIDIINVQIADATVFDPQLEGIADRVLVDAPCSGLGLMRKKPEIRWNVSEQDLEELKKLQLLILRNAANYVKPDGILVYSTCTISQEENEQVIEEFLQHNLYFEPQSIVALLPDAFKQTVENSAQIRLYPNTDNCDGFFITKLKRVR